MDIQIEFGQRVKELRARCRMSQEMLAFRSGLDRTYISGVERGDRNISIVNIEKIAAALNVTVAYLFSAERFSTKPVFDNTIPFKERFRYHLDHENKLLAFQVNGFFSGVRDVEYISRVILGVCSAYGKEELKVLVDHRNMTSSNGVPVVYSQEVADSAVVLQREMTTYSKKVVALCNSDFMVHQLNHIAAQSGILEKSTHLYGQDQDMVGRSYELLNIYGNELIRTYD